MCDSCVEEQLSTKRRGQRQPYTRKGIVQPFLLLEHSYLVATRCEEAEGEAFLVKHSWPSICEHFRVVVAVGVARRDDNSYISCCSTFSAHVEVQLQRNEGVECCAMMRWARWVKIEFGGPSFRRVFNTRRSFQRATPSRNKRIFSFTRDTMQADDDNKEEKLKAALWYAVGQTVDSIALSQDFNADSKFIGGE